MNSIRKEVNHETAVTRYYKDDILRKEIYAVGLVAYYSVDGKLLKLKNLND